MVLDSNAPWPFIEMIRTREGRSMSMEDLGEHDVSLLARAAREATDPWLRARLADVAVSVGAGTSADWRLGRLAIEAYVDYVESVFGTERAIDGLDECQRVLKIFRAYAKKDQQLWERLWRVVLQEIEHSIEKAWPGLALTLCDEAKERNREVAEAAIPLLKSKVAILADGNPLEAERYYSHISSLCHRVGKKGEARQALLDQGEALAKLALTAMSTPHQAILASEWMVKAIDVLRRARTEPSRIRELRDHLSTIQRASLDQFVGHSFRTDVSQIYEAVEQAITGPTLFEALLQTAFAIDRWLDYDALRADVLDSARKHPLSMMFSSSHTNSEGRIIAREEPFDPNNEGSIVQKMITDARQFHLGMRGQVVVPAMTNILHSRFQVPFFAIKDIVAASPVTPSGHSETLARGLHAGITGDWIATGAYLIPNMEPFVRTYLRRHDVHTSVFRDGDVEHERTLSELLAMPEAEDLFGKGLLLELKVLLTEQLGFNLRHQYCHGLLRDDQLGNTGVLALWLTVLRLIMFPWVNQPRSEAPSPESADEAT